MVHHHRHRSMRLKKPKLPPSSSRSNRARQGSVATIRTTGSASSTNKDVGTSEPAEILEARHRAAEEAKKLQKANLFLNAEVKGATTSQSSLPLPLSSAISAGASSTVPVRPGSVTNDSGSYLARLASQAAGHNDDAESVDDVPIRHSRRGPPGVVRRMAERHHKKVQKRDKRRRLERLKRIAALDPLQEAQREHGQAKETKFMALIRKYGSRAQEEARRAKAADTSTIAEGEDGETTMANSSNDSSPSDEQSAYLVDTLDIVDPGVSAAGHLSNIGNSLMFPSIPGLYDRRPVIDLPSQEVDPNATKQETQLQLESGRLPASSIGASRPLDDDDLHLDAYVHELLTKRQQFKRAMQGVWAFLKTPIGVIAGIYGFLVVFGGAALVLFLIGAIDGGKNKDFWVEVFSQFENGLFTIPGVGLIPWRVRDTYRMAWIAYYQHLTWRLRKKQGLPALTDKNDIPSVPWPKTIGGKEVKTDATAKSRKSMSRDKSDAASEIELQEKAKSSLKDTPNNEYPSLGALSNQASGSSRGDASSSSSSSFVDIEDEKDELPAPVADQVLTPQQAARLNRLQILFAESQSWYRPHETSTHHAFSISFALSITVMNDMNSLFQCLLCGYMWGYATHYHDRPAWSTGTFMPVSFLAGIGAAILIWRGGERSKKKREVEERLLEAFAKDIDEQVQETRRQLNEQRQQPQLLSMNPDLATVPENDPALDTQLRQEKHPLDLDTLANEVAAESRRSLPPSQ